MKRPCQTIDTHLRRASAGAAPAAAALKQAMPAAAALKQAMQGQVQWVLPLTKV
jgi:hypothetical protein